MFDTFNGLPLHPLAVHAVIALIPLSGMLGIVFAVPRTRAWARWPLLLVAVSAACATFVARQSGQELADAGGLGAAGLGGPVADLIEEHQRLATQLQLIVIAYAVVAAGALLLTRTSATGGVVHGVAGLLVVGALVMTFWSYRVGDLGAQAVWNPDGTVDYSGPVSDG